MINVNFIYYHLERVVFAVSFLLLQLFNTYTLSSQNSAFNSVKDSLDYMNIVDSSFIYGNRAEYDLSIKYLQKAIEKYPKCPTNIMLLNNIGGLYQLLGDYDKAIMAYSAALQKSPDMATIRYNRALLQGKLKRNKESITDFSILISASPNNQLYRYQRGILYILEKDYNLAESDFMNILDNDNSSIKAREGLAILETMRGNYNKAERLFDFIIDKIPDYGKAYEGRARMFFMRKMLGFALRDSDKALTLSKGNPSLELLQLRIEIFNEIGDKESAKNEEKKLQQFRNKLKLD